jgi:glycosyltransferase involved in cell wall biosynthesis
MRVLLVTQPSDGGVFEHVVRLGRGLRAEGHEVLIAGPLRRRAGELDLPTVDVPMGRSVSPRSDALAALALGRLVRHVRPDLVHAHSSKAGAVARVTRVAAPRVPLVYTPHGYAFAGYFESERERSAYRLVERALAPLATCVLCVCEAERRLAASVGNASRTRVVHNGVPPVGDADPLLAVAALRRRGPVIAVLTLLRPGKGIETLIDAVPRLVDGRPDVNLAIAGDGPDRESLTRRAADLGVADRVHFVGEVRGPGPVMRAADVFVSPSWAESFPLSVLEAMSAGLPVVTTDVGGCAEAVADGETGMVVPPRDAPALAAALRRMLDDPVHARALGAAGRRRWEERFTVRRMIEGTTAAYRELSVYH